MMRNLRLKEHALPTGERTCIMGILNVTPDSFSDGGMYLDPSCAAEQAKRMVDEGADIIDIGGESSRPGSERISLDEELERVIPVIKALNEALDVPISIDTYKSEVARQALASGASIVNDITALEGDPLMAQVVAETDAAIILMHMKGRPGTMQDAPFYGNVVEEIFTYLEDAVTRALEAGIDPERIAIDPGIGFGKTTEHNIEILKSLSRFKDLDKPILIGTSRKAFIGELTGKEVSSRAFGTAASFTAAIMNGANIIRVHDVGQMRDAARVADALKGTKVEINAG